MVKWLLFQLVFEELIAENKIIISTHEPRDVFVNEHISQERFFLLTSLRKRCVSL